MFTTRQGLSIIYLSGVEQKKRSGDDDEDEKETNDITFNLKDVEQLEANFERRRNAEAECVDLLITNQWPKYVEKQSNQQIVNLN